MLFNSLVFLVFFPIVFSIYWLLKDKRSSQNWILLFASYVFYGWWDWRFLVLILMSSTVDFFVGAAIERQVNLKSKKLLLIVSLLFNLGLLGFFKYYNFFVESLTESLELVGFSPNLQTLSIILPVGISFYTFQTLSYTIDIYYGRIKPTKDVVSFFTFVAFFPQLVAGPIERASHLLPQFENKRVFNYADASKGFRLILVGFFKKVVIADTLAPVVDIIFNSPGDYSGAPLIFATLLFAIQIYCDFSGYSDIAIGLSRLMGFDLMTNFRQPYFAMSITDFWRRWHISLSTWFRDYVYIPLGGNKGTAFRAYYNVFITFLVSGLWHGANWTFIIWGAFHGVLLIIERITIKQREGIKRAFNNQFAFNTLAWISTFICVLFGWIFFRANTVSDAGFIVTNLFSDMSNYLNVNELKLKFRGIGWTEIDLIWIGFLIVMLIFIDKLINQDKLNRLLDSKSVIKWGFYYLLFILIIFSSGDNSAQNFIYFQF